MPTRWDASRTALASIAEAVGRTPLVRLNRVTAGVKPEVLLKIEWYGPTGSLKDRIYLHMFERAEARGELTRGMRVLECSTGNAGIACAFVAAVKGYPCTIVMPEGMSDERKKIARAYGADLVFTPRGASGGPTGSRASATASSPRTSTWRCSRASSRPPPTRVWRWRGGSPPRRGSSAASRPGATSPRR